MARAIGPIGPKRFAVERNGTNNYGRGRRIPMGEPRSANISALSAASTRGRLIETRLRSLGQSFPRFIASLLLGRNLLSAVAARSVGTRARGSIIYTRCGDHGRTNSTREFFVTWERRLRKIFGRSSFFITNPLLDTDLRKNSIEFGFGLETTLSHKEILKAIAAFLETLNNRM